MQHGSISVRRPVQHVVCDVLSAWAADGRIEGSPATRATRRRRPAKRSASLRPPAPQRTPTVLLRGHLTWAPIAARCKSAIPVLITAAVSSASLHLSRAATPFRAMELWLPHEDRLRNTRIKASTTNSHQSRRQSKQKYRGSKFCKGLKTCHNMKNTSP